MNFNKKLEELVDQLKFKEGYPYCLYVGLRGGEFDQLAISPYNAFISHSGLEVVDGRLKYRYRKDFVELDKLKEVFDSSFFHCYEAWIIVDSKEEVLRKCSDLTEKAIMKHTNELLKVKNQFDGYIRKSKELLK